MSYYYSSPHWAPVTTRGNKLWHWELPCSKLVFHTYYCIRQYFTITVYLIITPTTEEVWMYTHVIKLTIWRLLCINKFLCVCQQKAIGPPCINLTKNDVQVTYSHDFWYWHIINVSAHLHTGTEVFLWVHTLCPCWEAWDQHERE